MASLAGAVPYIEPSSAPIEQVLRRARALGGDTVTVPVFDLGSARTSPAIVTLIGTDTAEVVG